MARDNKKNLVGFVGDGLNDCAALASAPTVPRALRHRDARKRFRDACGAFLSRAKGYLHTE